MNRKRVALVGIAAMLLVATMIGGTMAYFRAETTTNNKIRTGSLGIELLKQVGDKKTGFFGDNEIVPGMMPGESVPEKIWAKNTEDYDLYVKVTLKKYWEDKDGNKVFDADAGFIEVETKQQEQWIIHNTQDQNKEEIYFYYKMPMSSNDSTEPLIDEVRIGNIPAAQQSKYAGLRIKLEATADAVQCVANASGGDSVNKEAILSEWGLDVEMKDNVIVSVQE